MLMVLVKALIAVAVMIICFGLGFMVGRSYEKIHRRMMADDKRRRQRERAEREMNKADRISYIYGATSSVTGKGW